MFETTSASRTPTFDYPSHLKPNMDFGNSTWGAGRSMWNGGSAGTDNGTEGETSKPRFLRQISTTVKFGKTTHVPLSPIDNPRTSGPSSRLSWATSNSRTIDTNHRHQLTSPVKQSHTSWIFKERLDSGAENSSLFAGSAPEIDYVDDRSVKDSRPSTRGFQSSVETTDRSPYFEPDVMPQSNSRFPMLADTNPSYLPASTQTANGSVSGSFAGYPSKSKEPVSTTSPNPSPTSRGFARGSALRNGPSTISPTQSRFSKQSAFESYLNGHGLNSQTSADLLSHNFTNLGLGQNHQDLVNDQGSARYGFDMPQPSGHSLATNAETPLSRLRSEAGFQSTAFAPFESTHGPTQAGQFNSIWNYGDHESYMSVGTDHRHSISSPYYSATATPPTGPESIRSAGGSGISSRTSHHDIVLIDRKLRNLDLPQQYQHAATNGYLPGPGPAHDLSFHSSAMRMNPLAAPYHVANTGSYGFGYPSSLRMPARDQETTQIIRSPLLEEFRVNIKTNKRYELRDIFGHVVEFSGDQHGSRFIQLKLETANSDEKDQIFKEIQPNSLQLMTDVFGNYVIQKLFEHGNQAQKKVLANHIKGHVLGLSMQMYGCRVVQKALEHILTDQQASLVKELDGPNKQILKVIRDQNGNHVVQKAIERVPAEHIQFIIEAHRGEVAKLATHTYGCRVIQRILEHCEPAGKRVILDEFLGCVEPLITDSFGNYVVQHVIRTGEPNDRRRVVSVVQQQLLLFSKHKFASNVVEKCIVYADDDQRAEIVAQMIGHNEEEQSPVLGLLRDQFGNYVIQRIHANIKGAELEALTREMKLCLPQLKRTSYGKQVMAIEKLLYGTIFPVSSAGSSPSSTTEVSGQPQRAEDHNTAQAHLERPGQGQGPVPAQVPFT